MTALFVDEYVQWLRVERRLSAHTLSAANADLHKLLHLLGDQPADTLHIRSALSRLNASGLAPRSLARIASSWRGYFKWAIEFKGLSVHPMTGLKTPKRDKTLPKALSPDAALMLVKPQDPSADSAQSPESGLACIYVIADLLYATGMRLSELLSLDVAPGPGSVSWIDWSEGVAHVTGKGSKQRSIPIPGQTLIACKRWLSERTTRAAVMDEKALFINLKGRRLSPRTVQKQLARLAHEQGVDRHVHPHMLRHSYASHVLQSSGDLRAVQELLGHSSIASTQIYTSLDFQHLAAVYDKAHPRAKQK